MEYIKGKYRTSIFDGNGGYKVGLFRVKEASDNLDYLINHTVTFNGLFHELNEADEYIFYGEYIHHDKYGYQFKVNNYERVEPTGENAVIEFLTSSFVKGCGEKTAVKIVSALGENAINLIKKDINNLYRIGINEKTAMKIYNSIMSYYDADETIMYLRSLDFSVNEINKLLNVYGTTNIKNILENDLYSLIEYVDFKKLDQVFFRLFESTNEMRILACIIESIKNINFENGDTYCYKEEINNYLSKYFKIEIDNIEEYLDILKFNKSIKNIDDKYYLKETYDDEQFIEKSLTKINNKMINECIKIDQILDDVEFVFHIKYNKEQRDAIKSAINNNVTIITGGPGTGKTTIIQGILFVYKELNKYTERDMNRNVALLAPTGRASKRMSEATHYGASTIHRYLKWNRDLKEFGVNEYNKLDHRLLIVDEVSMIDNNLMASLLKGVYADIKLVLVGDEHQLPSVGPGNVLKDIIDSEHFKHIRLKNIYRQSENSFIPILASEIKKCDITSDYLIKRDDYNFLKCSSSEIRPMLSNIVLRCIEKGLNEMDIQVLAPMYKGENGLDNLNLLLQNIFNPKSKDKEEVLIGSVLYRENDKVINLVNNVDVGIYNGDIGYIKSIDSKSSDEFMTIDFDGNVVSIKRDEMGQIKHAYALSIHKSQGSEFNHVIIPLTKEYNRMLYNRLLYTGISRAKKSLVMIGDVDAFIYSVNNNYSVERKTTLFKNNIK